MLNVGDTIEVSFLPIVFNFAKDKQQHMYQFFVLGKCVSFATMHLVYKSLAHYTDVRFQSCIFLDFFPKVLVW